MRFPGPGALPAPTGSGGPAYAVDRPALPARESLERLPARGMVAMFEAPRDASSLAVIRRGTSHRRREPCQKAVRIDVTGYLRDDLPRGEGEMPSL